MEWSKVESRCPICKTRFSAIRRPPKPPIFPSQRVVRVPLRDQKFNAMCAIALLMIVFFYCVTFVILLLPAPVK
nr:autophagy-related protein 36 [Ipomoea batatas]